jgi:hypothetical protein
MRPLFRPRLATTPLRQSTVEIPLRRRVRFEGGRQRHAQLVESLVSPPPARQQLPALNPATTALGFHPQP